MVKTARWRYADAPNPFKAGTINADLHDMLTALAKKRDGVVDKWSAQRLIKVAKEAGAISSKRDSHALLEDYLTQTMRHDILIAVRRTGE